MIASTYFALLAEFGTAEIPLERCCHKYFALDEREAKRRASLNRLPVPAYRIGSQKAGWLISAEHLAKELDRQRMAAEQEWAKSQTASATHALAGTAH